MPAVRSAATKRSLTFINTLLVTTAFTVPAFAQIETVVVTAEKRAENLQTVPVAVTAITGEQLKQKNIQTFKDLQYNVPNITYQKGALGSGAVTIRGIGQAAGDPGISQYNNGVFTEDTDLQSADYYDLKDIEVLRGPQGTLYGRASVGGLINVYSATPDFDALSATGDFTYGEFNTIKGTGVLNIPITDTLAVRFAGQYTGHDGYIKNIAPGFENPNSQNIYSGRATIRWQPDADTTIDLVGSYALEADSRDRIDGIQCHTDPTGVIGCLPDKLAFEPVNSLGNAIGILDSKQWMGTLGAAVGLNVAPAVLGAFGTAFGAPSGAAFTGPEMAFLNAAFGPLLTFGDVSGATYGTILGGNDTAGARGALAGLIIGGYATAGGKAGIFDLTQANGSLGTGTSPTIQNAMPKKLGVVNNNNNTKFDEFQPQFSFHLNHKLNSWLTTDVIAGYSATVRHSQGPYSYFPQETYSDSFYRNSFVTDGGFGLNLACQDTPGPAPAQHCNPVDNLAEFSLLAGASATRVGNMLANYFPNNATIGESQLFPLSNFNPGGIAFLPSTPGNTGNGIASFVTGNSAMDLEQFHGRETSAEWRFTSNLDGPFNFTAGFFFYDRRNYNEPYRVTFNGGDYFSIFAGSVFTGTVPSAGDQPYIGIDPYYYQDVTTTSNSKAVYFDMTYDLTDDLQFKGGLRWQEDRDHLINNHLSFTALNSPTGCGGAFCFAAATSTAANILPFARSLELAGVSTNPDTTDRVNGRAVLQWSPKLDFTDQTMIYASYSRGSKAGNVNLVSGVALAEGVPQTFKPEDLSAYEIGTKNTLFDGTLQANLTGWYYQYQNFQYTVVQFSTLFTQNFNAHMWGEEGEFIWQPTEDFVMNLNLTNSGSSIAGGQFAADARNPTAGRTDAVLVKDDTLSATDFPGGNCVIIEQSGLDPASDPGVTAFYASHGLPNAFVAPVAGVGGPTALRTPGNSRTNIQFANFGTCSANFGDPGTAGTINNFLNTFHATSGVNYYAYANTANAGPGSSQSGVAVPLAGKHVLNLPMNTISVGAQYTFHIDGFTLVPRVDYYWQDGYFSRIFNDPTDFVPSWDQLNLQMQLNAPDARWYLKVFATNVMDKRNPIGYAPQSDTSGVPTYVSTMDPRIVGVTIGARY